MKFLLTLFLITPFVCYSQTNTKSAKEFYYQIQKQFKIIDSLRRISSLDMEIESDKIFSLIKNNKEIVFNLPDTLDFDLLYITKSADKKFCLVSWDTRLGGTEIDYASIALYKSDNKIYYQKQIEYWHDSSENNPQYYYTDVYQINSSKNTIYIAKGFGQGSTTLPEQEAKAFQINNNTLIHPKIFPGNNYQLQVEFDIHASNKNQRVPTIKIKDNNKLILVPVSNKDGSFSMKYDSLRFDGLKFRKLAN